MNNNEHEKYFRGDLMTIFDALAIIDNNESAEKSRLNKLAIYDIENMLPRAITNLERFYKFYPERRKEGYNFLTNSIKQIEKIHKANKESLDEQQRKYLQILKNEIATIFNRDNQSVIQKLKWKGKPAHLALVIETLIKKGYIEQPSPYGERTAKILLNLFDFEEHNPTPESLGKLLGKDDYPINDMTVIDRFNRIPERSELK